MSDRYEIVQLLGKGRAGEVYEAADTLMLGRKVALRRFTSDVIHTALDDQWKKRYMGVIRGLSQFNHPNILDVIDGGIDDNGPYIVTTFVEGLNIYEQLEGDGFNIIDAYEMVDQVLDALTMAMLEGFYHYSMSPTSVILKPKTTGGYNYSMTDLGYGKLLPMLYGDDKAIPMTQSPALLPPELYKGRPEGVRTSQYLLGHLIYWMLAGEHPFAKMELHEAYLEHKKGSIPCLSTYRPEVPRDLLKWLKKVMSPNHNDRFHTIGEALEHFPAAPKRFYAKKVALPPKPIREDDLGKSR